jgi:hypothetical protein
MQLIQKKQNKNNNNRTSKVRPAVTGASAQHVILLIFISRIS